MYRFSKNFQKVKYLDERKEEASFIGVDSIQVFFCSPQHFLKLQWQFFISILDPSTVFWLPSYFTLQFSRVLEISAVKSKCCLIASYMLFTEMIVIHGRVE